MLYLIDNKYSTKPADKSDGHLGYPKGSSCLRLLYDPKNPNFDPSHTHKYLSSEELGKTSVSKLGMTNHLSSDYPIKHDVGSLYRGVDQLWTTPPSFDTISRDKHQEHLSSKPQYAAETLSYKPRFYNLDLDRRPSLNNTSLSHRDLSYDYEKTNNDFAILDKSSRIKRIASDPNLSAPIKYHEFVTELGPFSPLYDSNVQKAFGIDSKSRFKAHRQNHYDDARSLRPTLDERQYSSANTGYVSSYAKDIAKEESLKTSLGSRGNAGSLSYTPKASHETLRTSLATNQSNTRLNDPLRKSEFDDFKYENDLNRSKRNSFDRRSISRKNSSSSIDSNAFYSPDRYTQLAKDAGQITDKYTNPLSKTFSVNQSNNLPNIAHQSQDGHSLDLSLNTSMQTKQETAYQASPICDLDDERLKNMRLTFFQRAYGSEANTYAVDNKELKAKKSSVLTTHDKSTSCDPEANTYAVDNKELKAKKSSVLTTNDKSTSYDLEDLKLLESMSERRNSNFVSKSKLSKSLEALDASNSDMPRKNMSSQTNNSMPSLICNDLYPDLSSIGSKLSGHTSSHKLLVDNSDHSHYQNLVVATVFDNMPTMQHTHFVESEKHVSVDGLDLSQSLPTYTSISHNDVVEDVLSDDSVSHNPRQAKHTSVNSQQSQNQHHILDSYELYDDTSDIKSDTSLKRPESPQNLDMLDRIKDLNKQVTDMNHLFDDISLVSKHIGDQARNPSLDNVVEKSLHNSVSEAHTIISEQETNSTTNHYQIESLSQDSKADELSGLNADLKNVAEILKQSKSVQTEMNSPNNLDLGSNVKESENLNVLSWENTEPRSLNNHSNQPMKQDENTFTDQNFTSNEHEDEKLNTDLNLDSYSADSSSKIKKKVQFDKYDVTYEFNAEDSELDQDTDIDDLDDAITNLSNADDESQTTDDSFEYLESNQSADTLDDINQKYQDMGQSIYNTSQQLEQATGAISGALSKFARLEEDVNIMNKKMQIVDDFIDSITDKQKKRAFEALDISKAHETSSKYSDTNDLYATNDLSATNNLQDEAYGTLQQDNMLDSYKSFEKQIKGDLENALTHIKNISNTNFAKQSQMQESTNKKLQQIEDSIIKMGQSFDQIQSNTAMQNQKSYASQFDLAHPNDSLQGTQDQTLYSYGNDTLENHISYTSDLNAQKAKLRSSNPNYHASGIEDENNTPSVVSDQHNINKNNLAAFEKADKNISDLLDSQAKSADTFKSIEDRILDLEQNRAKQSPQLNADTLNAINSYKDNSELVESLRLKQEAYQKETRLNLEALKASLNRIKPCYHDHANLTYFQLVMKFIDEKAPYIVLLFLAFSLLFLYYKRREFIDMLNADVRKRGKEMKKISKLAKQTRNRA